MSVLDLKDRAPKNLGAPSFRSGRSSFRFYLGTHKAHWLGLTDVPLFVSRRVLEGVRRLPRALGPWGLDSGGFTELSMFGRWWTSVGDYVGVVRRLYWEVGSMAFAAPMDWMCEPVMVARSGLSVCEHQRRTVENYLELSVLGGDLPFVPVLQGWTLGDYLSCVELYDRAGVDLRRLPLVGLGSVCRRQGSSEIVEIVSALSGLGLRLHGFGVKERGLYGCLDGLVSSDSLAWSSHARRRAALPGHGHSNCANCLEYALWWRSRLLSRVRA